MYKNLSEIISKDSYKKRLVQSRVVVPKKHFFLITNCKEQFFRVQYFTKEVVANHSSMDKSFLRGALATINGIY